MEFLERRFGFAKIREALVAYGRGERGAAVLERLSRACPPPSWSGSSATICAGASRATTGSSCRRRRWPRRAKTPDRRAAPALSDVEAGLAALAERRPQGGRGGAERAQGAAGKDASASATAAILFLTGELALASREAEPAIAAFEQLLALGPDHDGYDVRVRLALAEIHRKNPAAAEQHLRRAIALRSDARRAARAARRALHRRAPRGRRLAEMDAALALEPQTAKLAKELVLGLGRAQRPGRASSTSRRSRSSSIPPTPTCTRRWGARWRPPASRRRRPPPSSTRCCFTPPRTRQSTARSPTLYRTLGDREKAEAHRLAARQASPRRRSAAHALQRGGDSGGGERRRRRRAPPAPGRAGKVSVSVVPSPHHARRPRSARRARRRSAAPAPAPARSPCPSSRRTDRRSSAIRLGDAGAAESRSAQRATAAADPRGAAR